MMRLFHGFVISVSLAACATPSHQGMPVVKYSEKDLVQQRTVASESPLHSPNKTYVSLDLPYSPFEKLRHEIEMHEGLELQHRGEAHLTLISPSELKALKKKIPQSELNQFFNTQNISKLPFKMTCVGRAQALNDSASRAYYVVVDSEKSYEIRHRLQSLFVQKGGAENQFDPEAYYPHITLGFTDRDLHLEDGIKKDASTCILALQQESQARL